MKINLEEFKELSFTVNPKNKEVKRIFNDLNRNMIAIVGNNNQNNKYHDIGREAIDIMKNEISNARSQLQLLKIIVAYYLLLDFSGLGKGINVYMSFKTFQIAYQELYAELPFELPFQLDSKKIMDQLD